MPEKVVYGLLSRAQGYVQTIILRCQFKRQTKKFSLFPLVVYLAKIETSIFIWAIIPETTNQNYDT